MEKLAFIYDTLRFGSQERHSFFIVFSFQHRLNSNKGTKCDIESRATRMLAGVQLCNLQFLSALAPSLTASFALRPGDRSESS